MSDPTDVKNLVHGRVEAVHALAAAGCDLVLGGHIHLPFTVDLRTRFAPLARTLWTVQAGTAVSSRTRDGVPNSVNLIAHDAGVGARRCTVEAGTSRSRTARCLRHATELDLATRSDRSADSDRAIALAAEAGRLPIELLRALALAR